MNKMRYRQVHLDFHVSGEIRDIGKAFDTEEFIGVLKKAHVDSVTCFSKCHHGWSYHHTEAGQRHPHLVCELLPLQIEACHKEDIKVPVYLSVGYDELAARQNPQWCVVDPTGQGRPPFFPGWHKMCLNTDYLDYMITQTEEVVRRYDADGIFLDILLPWDCCCSVCVADMQKEMLNPESPEDRKEFRRKVLHHYYRRMNDAIHAIKPDMPVFHNSGHIFPEFNKYQSHFEIESLPTGGWGYDHYPLSARYCSQLGLEYLGMTGKFHTTWGEYGGFKHPNALKYECSAILAHGAKCSVGDQLHPCGRLDRSTYDLIGEAYKEVEEKEVFCRNVSTVSEVGLLASDFADRKKQSDTGACRILLEGHFLFDVLDAQMDFSKYKVLILPDDCQIDSALKTRLDVYLKQGGKLFLTGRSGFGDDGKFLFDAGADFFGPSEYLPDYIVPEQSFSPGFVSTPMVMYMRSERVKATVGKSLGQVYDPYFNRTYDHFCGHHHSPACTEPSGYDCGVLTSNICYLAHSVFSIYSAFGTVALKEYIIKSLTALMGDVKLTTSLPSTARVSLMKKKDSGSYILHLLYAATVKRGGEMNLNAGTIAGKSGCIEVVEDLIPLHDVEVELAIDGSVESVRLQPQNQQIPFAQKDRLTFKVDRLLCHQMVEIVTKS